MKIRNGFVSNSSSSSFIVIFPREPKSMEEVRDMLFDKDQKIYGNPYYDPKYYNIEDSGWDVNKVATTVWNDICKQTKNDIPTIIEELKGCSKYDDPEAPDYDDFKHIKEENKRWEALNNAEEVFAKKKIKEFLNIRKAKLKKINNEEDYIDNAVYVFEYSDNDGSYGSSLEHGNLFHKLKHIRISKH